MNIITDHKPRPLLDWYELTEAEQKEFDWIDNPEGTGYPFFRYKKQVYSLQNFTRVDENNPLKTLNYDGIECDSFFSSTLIKFTRDGEGVIVARCYS